MWALSFSVGVHWGKEGSGARAGWHPPEAASVQSRVLGRVCILSSPQPCWSGPPDPGSPSLARIQVPQESGELACMCCGPTLGWVPVTVWAGGSNGSACHRPGLGLAVTGTTKGTAAHSLAAGDVGP